MRRCGNQLRCPEVSPHSSGARTLSGVDEYGQPHCPEDDIVMHDIPGGWKCPHCGHLQLHDDVETPPEFDGPTIHGG